MPRPVREYVTHRAIRLPIYPWTDPRSGREYWRFAWPDATAAGGWRYGTKSTKEAAREAAHEKATTLAKGHLVLAELSAETRRLLQAAVDLGITWDDIERLRRWKSAGILPMAQAVERFREHLASGQNLTRHHEDTLRTLRLISEAHPGAVQSLDKEAMQAWLNGQPVGATRKKQLRAHLSQFFRWAKVEGLVEAPNGVTEADKLAVVRVKKAGTIAVFTPAQMRYLLQQVAPAYLPWLVLGGFSGLRSEEIHPRNAGDKPSLDWSMVHISRGFIELPPEISKVNKRRLIPIGSTLASWLRYIAPPKSGRVVPGPPSKREIKRLGDLLAAKFKGQGWVKNGLRHSFLSYETAIRKDLPALAIEAGTSVRKLNDNYVEAVTPAVARRFFALTPSEVSRKQASRKRRNSTK